MIRLRRIRWMIKMANAERESAWFRFGKRCCGPTRWLEKHGLLLRREGAFADTRLSEKGKDALRASLAEYEARRGGLK